MIRHPEARAQRASKDDGPGFTDRILRGPLRRHLSITVSMLAIVGATSAARAQSIEEKAQVCGACHGEKGKPAFQAIPVIWGQQLGYLYLQLRDFKSGARKNEQMAPIIEPLQRDDLMALAKYFSEKPWPNLEQPRASDAVAAQAARANTSIACTGCHQEGYKGEGTQPRLAGQSKDYLAKTMADFRSGARGNNPGMTDLMKATPLDDITPLAVYLAGL
jgi:cytochrome c553